MTEKRTKCDRKIVLTSTKGFNVIHRVTLAKEKWKFEEFDCSKTAE